MRFLKSKEVREGQFKKFDECPAFVRFLSAEKAKEADEPWEDATPQMTIIF